jgi:hypothetical protein
VAVEKLGISEIRENFGDRKCLAEKRMSFVGLPDAICAAKVRESILTRRNLGSKVGSKYTRMRPPYPI